MSQNTIHRRSVVQGIAWAAPVVTMTAAAPAFAVSPSQTPNQPITLTTLGSCFDLDTSPYAMEGFWQQFTVYDPDTGNYAMDADGNLLIADGMQAEAARYYNLTADGAYILWDPSIPAPSLRADVPVDASQILVTDTKFSLTDTTGAPSTNLTITSVDVLVQLEGSTEWVPAPNGYSVGLFSTTDPALTQAYYGGDLLLDGTYDGLVVSIPASPDVVATKVLVNTTSPEGLIQTSGQEVYHGSAAGQPTDTVNDCNYAREIKIRQ